jgi:hypothetical protein
LNGFATEINKKDLYEKNEMKLTRYVDRVKYDEVTRTVRILFNEGPDEWKPSHHLIFENVESFYEEIIDDKDYPGKENFTDLVIGFDEVHGGLCLHLTCVEFGFKPNSVPKFINISA